MDDFKTFTVKRFFSIKETSPSKDSGVISHYFQMYSVFDGQFGQVTFSVAAFIDDPSMKVYCNVMQDSGESLDTLFALRNQEVRFFFRVLPLFNPINFSSYEKVSSSSESPEF